MAQRTNNSRILDNTGKQNSSKSSKIGIVFDVILNENYEGLFDSDDSEIFSTGKDTSIIGACIIRDISDNISSESKLRPYRPLDPHNLDIPLIGETVELVVIGNSKYYRRLPAEDLNIGNARENLNKDVFIKTESDTTGTQSYNTTSQTGIVNTSGNNERNTNLGKYFEPTQANRLRMYEGDKLIQSRYGQSIRFSAYNNPNNSYAPTIIIRNRQNDISIGQLASGDITEEDINRDGSTILMTSNQFTIPFQPGIIDDGGSSNFESKPENFDNYPSELTNSDQLLINSGRIILSSKSGEMIFYSKGNYGFISDGKFSIDNGNAGAQLNFNGDVRTTMNDNNYYVLGGSTGKIFLNTESESEPLVRGETLKKILEEMIDLIVAQVYQTPAGPSAPGPTNQSDFRKLKTRLSEMLSTLNFTDPE